MNHRYPHLPSSAGSDLLLRVYLLGGFALVWGDVPLSPIVGRPARSLFAYLITYRHRPHTRPSTTGGVSKEK